ncbi:TPR domain-containing protein [Zopfia rhizophila CBS 207.26]|uniref:TPR domain-containing protein n=1 Tax=Zopfia rhizophila CBS 207.26 TaxID=1314779 RepID=A0A6A6DD21_9PEZI|nr:TPR domain-containing protein [Zopfia rhizophila CBS 207.26]
MKFSTGNAIPAENEYYNLGSYHRPITTSNPHAQTWFNRGLIWSYGFNHEESAVCFLQAIAHDSDCAMAYWGLAYALGPNYNKPWDVFDEAELQTTLERSHRAILEAKQRATSASPVERALVDALAYRYQREEPDGDCGSWNREYADAMTKAYTHYPNDLDVTVLYADALMNLTPWQLWDIRTGAPAPGARTLEIKKALEAALTQDGALSHPGLLHLYIHLMEMSASPESALPIADHLRGLVPDAGHLQHMPSHLDVLCGDYRRAISSNLNAVRADEKYFARSGPLKFYALYRVHDYHFAIYAAMFVGQSKVALDIVSHLEAAIPDALLRVKSPSMEDWFEGFVATRVHVLVRFGRWSDLVSLPLPSDQNLYCVTTALIHYGKGVAFAATASIEKAEEQLTLFQQSLKKVPENRMLFNNKCIDILHIAGAMLEGEIAYRKQDYDIAFTHLRRSISLDDSLPYDEPWGWMQPTRHAYGALLLEQGRLEEARAVYTADLGIDETLPRALRHPNNVWALSGLHECLTRLGRTAEVKILESQLRMPKAWADIEVRSSCFCALDGVVKREGKREDRCCQ